MEKDKKIHNTLLTIIGVMTLLVAVIGATFAYFSATYTAKPQNIKTGELKVSASSSIDHNENIKPTKWNGDDVSEIDETNENDITVVTLTVDTAGTTIDEAHYNIFLSATGIKLNETQVQVSQSGEKANRTGGTLSEIKWSLFDDENDSQIGSGNFGESGVADESGNVTNLQVNNIGKDIPITPDSLGDSEHIYKLYIWIQDTDDKQDKLQELNIQATLRVDAKQGLTSE